MTYGLAKGRQNPVSKCQYISRWRPLLCLFIGRAIVGVTISLGELGITAVGSAGRSVGNNATAFVVNGPLLTSSAKANKSNAQIPKKHFFSFSFFVIIVCHLDIFPLDAFSLIFIISVTPKYERLRSRM